MANAIWQATITDQAGNILPGAEVSVVDENTGLSAPLFSTRTGTAKSNPFFANSNGFAQFYAAPGLYRITATSSGTGVSQTWRYVRLVEIATNAEAIAGTPGVLPDAAGVKAAIEQSLSAVEGAVVEIQRQGAADWYADLAPYDLNAEVFYNSKRWRSTIANNSAVPESGPEWLDVTPGTAAAKDVATEDTAGTVPERDANGTFKVGAPTDPEHPVRIQEFDAHVDFTIIYPNGGSAASPASVATNSRYVMPNPFPGHFVVCQAEVQVGGKWGQSGWYTTIFNGDAEAYGTIASQLLPDDSVVLQTGLKGVCNTSTITGNPFAASGSITSAPCRVKVWKVKGAIT